MLRTFDAAQPGSVISILTGVVVIGGTAIQGLHARAKPPAYVVIPIPKVNDAAAFKAGVIDKTIPEALDVTRVYFDHDDAIEIVDQPSVVADTNRKNRERR
jgi:hypothetical protein